MNQIAIIMQIDYDWLKYFGIFTLIAVFALDTTIYARQNVVYQSDLAFIVIASVNFPTSQPGNYSYALNLTNPENYTIHIYPLVYTDPQSLVNFISFTTSVKNGTAILPNNSLEANVNITIFSNSFPEGEIYVRFYYLEKKQ